MMPKFLSGKQLFLYFFSTIIGFAHRAVQCRMSQASLHVVLRKFAEVLCELCSRVDMDEVLGRVVRMQNGH